MLNEECEEYKRFGLAKIQFANGSIWRKNLIELSKSKVFSKAERQKFKADADQKKESRYFYFSGAIKTLIKQWMERDINKSIELVDDCENLIHKFK